MATDLHPHPTPDDVPQPRSGKLMVAALLTFGIAVTLYFALGMPGMDHGSGASTHSMAEMDMGSATATHLLVDPAAFAARIAQEAAVVINVHVPYEGEIGGTHLFIPFDAIDVDLLPDDRTTPLVVYCRSGNMSAVAVLTLAGLGYTNIVELDGGMVAWEASGRSITDTGPSDD